MLVLLGNLERKYFTKNRDIERYLFSIYSNIEVFTRWRNRSIANKGIIALEEFFLEKIKFENL